MYEYNCHCYIIFYTILLHTGKGFKFIENAQANLKAMEEKEKVKAETYKFKAEEEVVRRPQMKPEYIPNEATIKELFFVQQVLNIL